MLAEPYLNATWAEKLAEYDLAARFHEHEGDDYPPSQPGDLGMPLERLARRHGPWVYGAAVALFLLVAYALVGITKVLCS